MVEHRDQKKRRRKGFSRHLFIFRDSPPPDPRPQVETVSLLHQAKRNRRLMTRERQSRKITYERPMPMLAAVASLKV